MATDPAVQKARARLAELEQLERERQELVQFLAVYDRLSAGVATPIKGAPPSQRSAPAQAPKTPTSGAVVLAAARELLTANGPMKLSDLYEAMLKRGLVIGGKKPRNTLGAILAGADDLATAPDVGWHLKNKAPDLAVGGLNGSGFADPEGSGSHPLSPPAG